MSEETAIAVGGPPGPVRQATDEELAEAISDVANALGPPELEEEYEAPAEPEPAAEPPHTIPPAEHGLRADLIEMRRERAEFRRLLEESERRRQELAEKLDKVTGYVSKQEEAEEARRRLKARPDPDEQPEEYAKWLIGETIEEKLSRRESEWSKREAEERKVREEQERAATFQENLLAAFDWEDANATEAEQEAVRLFLERRARETGSAQRALGEARKLAAEGWQQPHPDGTRTFRGYEYLHACMAHWGWLSTNGAGAQQPNMVESPPDEEIRFHQEIQEEAQPPAPGSTRPVSASGAWEEFTATWKTLAQHKPQVFYRRLEQFAEEEGVSVEAVRQRLLEAEGAVLDATP